MKYPLLLASALTLSLLTACGGTDKPAQSAAPAESTAPAESAAPTVPSDLPVLDWVAAHTATPDFLDQAQTQLYLQASCAMWIYHMNTDTVDSFPLADGTHPDLSDPYEVVTMGEQDYFVSRGRYALWADYSAMIRSLFTPSLSAQLLHDGLVAPTQDGRTAFVSAGRGANGFYDLDTPDSFTLVEQGEDYIVFTRTGHYIEPIYDEAGNPTADSFSYTNDFPVRLERTGAGWRVAELELPY